jgi:hypothetical protein
LRALNSSWKIVGNGKIKYWETISEQAPPLDLPYPGQVFKLNFGKMGNLPSFYMIRIAQKLSASSEKFLGIDGNGKIKYWETISEQGPP